MAKAKTATVEREAPKCPVTKEQFFKNAKPLMVTVNGTPMVATPKEFSSGSFGWYLNGKTPVEVDGVPVNVQLGFNLTVIGSKPDSK